MQVFQQVKYTIIGPSDLGNEGLLGSVIFDYSREGLCLRRNPKDGSDQQHTLRTSYRSRWIGGVGGNCHGGATNVTDCDDVPAELGGFAPEDTL